MRMLYALLRFIKALILHVRHGAVTLPSEEIRKRIRICYNCTKESNDICSLCHCYIPLKASWADQDCPQDFWNQPHLQEQYGQSKKTTG